MLPPGRVHALRYSIIINNGSPTDTLQLLHETLAASPPPKKITLIPPIARAGGGSLRERATGLWGDGATGVRAQRSNKMDEVLQGIRIIKYFAWEKSFRADISEAPAPPPHPPMHHLRLGVWPCVAACGRAVRPRIARFLHLHLRLPICMCCVAVCC